METPNAKTAGSGSNAEQVEFDAGANLARGGKQLPDYASDAAKRGFASVNDELKRERDSGTTAAQPGTSGEDKSKCLQTHRTAVVAQTDRPEPTATTAADAEPVNPNESVSITIDQPGMDYLVEGLGASTKISFHDVTEEALLAIVIDRLEGAGGVPADNFARNAASDAKKALDWLKQRVRDRLSRVVAPTTISGASVEA